MAKMRWTPTQMDRLEHAARKGLRVALSRRGTEYIVIAKRMTQAGGHERSSRDLFIYVRTAEHPTKVTPGFVEFGGQRNGMLAYQLSINPPDIGELLSDPRYGPGIRANGGMVIEDVIAHELNAHVFNSHPDYDTFCFGCPPSPAVQQENFIRAELGRPPRTY